MLLAAFLSGGMSSTDVASIVQPTHYFQTREIEISIDKMIELASRAPNDPKTQIQQLVALRHLADESDKLKKAANYAGHRQTLEKIAQGKLAADTFGFASDYAARVLRKLDNAKPPVVKTRPIREDALEWFPADVTFAATSDLRHGSNAANYALRDQFNLMPGLEKKGLYDFFEQCGNVRIERIAFGFVDAKDPKKRKLFLRITGKANQKWCVDALQAISGGHMTATPMKNADGATITLLNGGQNAPAILAIGNTDVLIGGYNGANPPTDELAAELLDIRAKKKPNAASGELKAPLAKIPDRAVAFALGAVPHELQVEFRFLLDAVPMSLSAFVERTPTGMDLQFEGTMFNKDHTAKFVQKMSNHRKEGITMLHKLKGQPPPLPPGSPPIPFQGLIDLLESLQVNGEADKAQLRVIVPDGLLQQAGMMGMIWGHAVDVAPPPAEVKKDK